MHLMSRVRKEFCEASVPIYRLPCYTAEAIIPMSWL
nr:MAG TPA: hypothetical protein [Caudoviricetes sp.]